MFDRLACYLSPWYDYQCTIEFCYTCRFCDIHQIRKYYAESLERNLVFWKCSGDLIKIRLVKYWLKSAPLPYCIAYRKSLFFIVWLVGEGGGRGLPRIFPFHFYMFLKKWGQPPMQRACIRYQVHVLFIICITSCVNVKTRIFIL